MSIFAFEIIKSTNDLGLNIEMLHHHDHGTRFASGQNLPAVRFQTQRYGNMSLKSKILQAYNELPEETKSLDESQIAKRRIISSFS